MHIIRKTLIATAMLVFLTGCADDRTVYNEFNDPVQLNQDINIDEVPDSDTESNTSNEITGQSEPMPDDITTTAIDESNKETDQEPAELNNSSYEPLPPNEIGEIMVIMYHGLREEQPKEQYERSVTDFKNDLQKLYDAGFRLIKLSDLINNTISVPAGYTPVVLTFDDGERTAFSLTDADGMLVPVVDCAVDIINKFCEVNKDFGKSATFFVNEKPYPFYGAGTLAQRFKYLLDNGFELGNHGSAHASLKKANQFKIEEEIGKADKMLRENTDGFIPLAMAYPYGERPAESYRKYVLNSAYDGIEYDYKYAFHVGYNGLSAIPYHVNFDPLNVPRVRGSDNANTDLGWHLRLYAEHPERRFVSDGNPDIVTVPQQFEDYVNTDLLNGKELHIY